MISESVLMVGHVRLLGRRYFFKVYALDVELALKPNSRKRDMEKAMQGHVLAKGELVGLYRRS